MGEKGYAVGAIGRSKGIFGRDAYENKWVNAAPQDGSREWTTVLAAVSAVGDASPHSIIYSATN